MNRHHELVVIFRVAGPLRHDKMQRGAKLITNMCAILLYKSSSLSPHLLSSSVPTRLTSMSGSVPAVHPPLHALVGDYLRVL